MNLHTNLDLTTSGTVTGKTVKNVIKGYVIDTDFQTVNDDSEIPFC